MLFGCVPVDDIATTVEGNTKMVAVYGVPRYVIVIHAGHDTIIIIVCGVTHNGIINALEANALVSIVIDSVS